MTIITFEEALCIFFGKEYIDENVQELMKSTENIFLKGGRLVYKDDPETPLLVYYKKVHKEPTVYSIYITKEELSRRLGMFINYIACRKNTSKFWLLK